MFEKQKQKKRFTFCLRNFHLERGAISKGQWHQYIVVWRLWGHWNYSVIRKVMIAILSSCFIQLWESNRDTSKAVRVMQIQDCGISLLRMQGIQSALSLQGAGARALRLKSVDVRVSYKTGLGTSLVVQQLGFWAPSVKGPGLIPGLRWGMRELVPRSFRHFPGGPVVKTELPMQWAWVQSLVRERDPACCN